MATPKVAAKKPIQLNLEKDEQHFWCACGGSKSQPFCDGSHRGTAIEPLAFSADQSGESYLCMCKRTKNPPYCDGSHNQLGDIEVEDPSPGSSNDMPLS